MTGIDVLLLVVLLLLLVVMLLFLQLVVNAVLSLTNDLDDERLQNGDKAPATGDKRVLIVCLSRPVLGILIVTPPPSASECSFTTFTFS